METTKEIIVGPVRFGFLAVTKPIANRFSEKEEYIVEFLVPKQATRFCPSPSEVLAPLRKAIKDVAIAAVLKGARNPLKDGDKPSAEGQSPRHPGYFTLRAKSAFPPVLIDGQRRTLSNGGALGWRSGDWGKVKIRLFAYTKGQPGVGVQLRAVQFLYHDEPLGPDPLDGFEPVADAHAPLVDAAHAFDDDVGCDEEEAEFAPFDDDADNEVIL